MGTGCWGQCAPFLLLRQLLHYLSDTVTVDAVKKQKPALVLSTLQGSRMVKSAGGSGWGRGPVGGPGRPAPILMPAQGPPPIQ